MYDRFASVYDQLMSDIPYAQFAELFRTCVQYTNREPRRVIDLGCGTGAMFPYMIHDARMIMGVDPSAPMLAVAAKRVQEHGVSRRISLYQGMADSFSVPEKAQWCVAFCDVFNYILTPEELVASFSRVRDNLTLDGYFLFDVHSVQKAQSGIGRGEYFDVSDEAVALMRTDFDAMTRMISYDLLLFSREEDGRYQRVDEWHKQRVHTLSEILRALSAAGFSKVHIGSDFSFAFNEESTVAMPQLEAQDDDMNQTAIEVVTCVDRDSLHHAQRWFFLATDK